MIELIVAAFLQLGTLTSDVTATQSPSSLDGAPTTTTTTTTTDGNPGGTGSWDDNG